MIAGFMIFGGMLTAVSSQAQDRRGGGRAPQQQSQSRSSSTPSQPSRPSMGSSNSNSSGRRPSTSQGSQSTNRRPEATPQPRTQQRPSTEARQQPQQQSTRQQSSNSGNVNRGATNRRPEPQVGNNGANNWPGSNANNRNSRPNNEMNTRPGNSGVNNGNARPQTGNNDRNARPDNNNRPDNNGNVRNDNNNGRRPGGNNRNMGNNGNRPGNSDRNMGNNGNRPGGNDRNRPGNSETHRQGQGPAGGGINHNGPGAGRPDYDRYRYSSDHRLPQPRVNDRFHDHYRYNDWSWNAPMRPPHRPYRPHDPWFYRPVRPYGYTIYASAPIISGVLGLEFGTPFGSSLNFLYYNGYEIDGYYDNIVYLRDVPMLDYVWPDVMLQYDNNGLAFIQFAVSSPYDDRARFSRLYNDLCYSYGPPIRRSGYNGYFSWYGGNGVGYVNLGLTYTNGRYYTSLSFGY